MERQVSSGRWCLYHKWAIEYTLRDLDLLEGEYRLIETEKGWGVELLNVTPLAALQWAGKMGDEFPLMRLSGVETVHTEGNRYNVIYRFVYIQ